MELRLIDPSCQSNRSDGLAGINEITFPDVDLPKMGIGADNAAVMLDENELAKAFDVVTDECHPALRRGTHYRAGLGGDVYAIIVHAARRGPEFGDDLAFDRPPKRPGPNRRRDKAFARCCGRCDLGHGWCRCRLGCTGSGNPLR